MDILSAIQNYCRYQERCHQEVRNRLYELGCSTPEVEEYISDVIESGLLNEERYARSFARGKFRLLHWGKVKIINRLKFSKVSDYCIKKGLEEINEADYHLMAEQLALRKLDDCKNLKSMGEKKAKVRFYLLQKGYEHDLTIQLINKLLKQQ